MMDTISIIVPARNEEENITALIKRIHAAIYPKNIAYEIIIIDDNSTDKTQSIAKNLAKNYPVSLRIKKGAAGKAQSLIEGFSYAKHALVCMIDADLQYPPESIPEMIAKIYKGADIVVANRTTYHTSKIRKFISNSFKYVFGSLLFGLDHDVQSGLKVFKKEILNIIDFTPESGWTFDLEFLYRASHAGYSIQNHDITFEKRNFGKSKISFFKTSVEIGFNALKTRLKKINPLHIAPNNSTSMEGAGIRFKKRGYITHTTLNHTVSAIRTFHGNQKAIIFVLLLAFLASFVLNPLQTLLGLIAILSAIYFIDVLFNLYLVWKSLHFEKELSFTKKELNLIDEKKLPVYSILCPLYKEAHVIPQFIKAINRLDWPKNKLDVMLLLEEDDQDSIDAVGKIALPSYMRIIIVPDSQPKTKPKACNYGLAKAKGEYLVIYDAEDIPEVDQLKKAYLGFQKAGKEVLCLQAKLNYYNPNHNLLTRLFTAEYSLWFDVSLTGLQALNTGIPLGGTSNHFKIKDLKKLQGWDPFNVTEDADLGIRLFNQGFKTAIIDSTTLEEANSVIKNWIRQRSRWIKGYMQTYLVHTRELFGFKNNKAKHTLIFHLVIGGKIAFILINPFLWLATISYFALYNYVGPTIEYLYPSVVFYMAATSLILGNFLFIYYYMVGAVKKEQWWLIKYIFLIPFYWLLISTAGFVALYQLIFKPHYWEKTIHGLHMNKALEQQAFALPAFLPRLKKAIKELVTAKGSLASGGALFFATATAYLLNLLFVVYMERRLNFEQFGLLSLILSLVYLTTIPMDAIFKTMHHEISFLFERYGKETAYSLWSNVIKKLADNSIMLSIIWLLLTPFLMYFFKSSTLFPLFLFTPILTFGFLTALNKGFLKGKTAFNSAAILIAIEPIVKMISAMVFFNLHLTQWAYAAIPFASVVTFVIGYFILQLQKTKNNSDTGAHNATVFSNKFLSRSVLAYVSALLFLNVDIIMAKHFLSASDAGQYALISLTGKIIFFVSTFLTIFIAPFVKQDEGEKKDSLYILDTSIAISSILAVLGFVFIGLFGNVTVPFIFGAKAYQITQYLLPFAFAIGCFSVSTVFSSYYFTKKVYTFSITTILLVIAQIIFISLFHSTIYSIVRVMLFLGYANLLTFIIFHIAIKSVKIVENNVRDFLGIFAEVKALPEKNIRILIFNWRDTRHRWAGGAEVYVQEIAKRWVEDGNSVTIFCGNDTHSPRNQVIDGIQIIRRGGFITVYLWAFLYYIVKLRGKFDVIVDAENGIPFLTPLYSRKPIFLLIHHVHQEVFRKHLPWSMAVIASFIEGKLMPLLYRNKSIITVSDSSKLEIIKLGFLKEKIEVVHPGINNSLFYKSEKAPVPTFLYLGRLKPYKNIDVLIKAFKKVIKAVPTAKLFIAGDGESASQIKKLVQTYRLTNHVIFSGKVTDEEKIQLLGYSWSAVQPSEIEGWGITVIEANASGTPVIASNVNGLRDSVVDGKTGILVETKNINAFAKAMITLAIDKKQRNELAKEAYEWSRHFSWEKSSEIFFQKISAEIMQSQANISANESFVYGIEK